MSQKKPTKTEKKDRDEKGRFLKNNKVAEKKFSISAVEKKECKNLTRAEVIKCAASLTKPWSTLKDDVARPDASRLEYLTAKAISNRHYRFVQWLIEMTIGKPYLSEAESEIKDKNGKKEITLKYSLD